MSIRRPCSDGRTTGAIWVGAMLYLGCKLSDASTLTRVLSISGVTLSVYLPHMAAF